MIVDFIIYLLIVLIWTEICLQGKEAGPCRGYNPRYYYDVMKGACVPFVYGGCKGNKNNFETYPECKRMCEDMLKRKLN